MNYRRRTIFRWILPAVALAMPGAPVHAQDFYPSQAIHLVCGYAAGTGADVIFRNIAVQLGSLAGKPVIMENKVGALTTIAAEYVARSKADGYTLFVTAGNSSFAANAYLFKKLPFDPIRSFAPVTTLARTPFVLLVSASQPIFSVEQLTKVLKQKKEKGSYGASTPLSVAASELYKSIAGIEAVQIPYRNLDQAAPEFVAGGLDLYITDPASAAVHIRANRVRAIAVTSAWRAPSMPELPTMIEAGVPNFDLTAWLAVYAPAGTPRPILEKLSGWFNQIVATEELKKVLASLHYEPLPGTPDGFQKFHAEEIEKWGKLLKAAKIQPQ